MHAPICILHWISLCSYSGRSQSLLFIYSTCSQLSTAGYLVVLTPSCLSSCCIVIIIVSSWISEIVPTQIHIFLSFIQQKERSKAGLYALSSPNRTFRPLNRPKFHSFCTCLHPPCTGGWVCGMKAPGHWSENHVTWSVVSLKAPCGLRDQHEHFPFWCHVIVNELRNTHLIFLERAHPGRWQTHERKK